MADPHFVIFDKNKVFTYPKDRYSFLQIDIKEFADMNLNEYRRVSDSLGLDFKALFEYSRRNDLPDFLPVVLGQKIKSEKKLENLDKDLVTALHLICAGYVINATSKVGGSLFREAYYERFQKQLSRQTDCYKELGFIEWLCRFNLITDRSFPEFDVFPELRYKIDHSLSVLEKALQITPYLGGLIGKLRKNEIQ